jgi:hypothetical protein
MRQLGFILILAGVGAFLYASSNLETAPPRDPGMTLTQEMASPGGRLEMLRYAGAGGAFLGILLAMFPKGR